MKHAAVIMALTVALAFACASSGGSARYQRDLGNASAVDAVTLTMRVVSRFQYEVLSYDSIPLIQIETHWKQRPPFEDETALGITAAESRVIITGRIRGETTMGSIYNLRMAVENRVRPAGLAEWNESTNTPMFREHADAIVQEFRQELLNIGVRRFATGS